MKRQCASPGCPTLLSSYNPDDRCFLHAVPHFQVGLSISQRERRQEELDGLHPEALEHTDNPLTDEEWEALRRRWENRICRIQDCYEPVRALQLCDRHYVARRRALEKLHR